MLHKKKLTPGAEYLAKNLWFTGPRNEPATISLLNGHNAKLPSKYLSLYPLASASLSPHHRSIFGKGSEEVSAEIHTLSNARSQRGLSPGSDRDIYITPSFSHLPSIVQLQGNTVGEEVGSS